MLPDTFPHRPGTTVPFSLAYDGGAVQGLAFCGERAGPTVAITAGMHGCEYVGIEAARRLLSLLEPKKLRGRVLLFPLLNPAGFFGGHKQVFPQDGQNLNRQFPGDPQGSHTQRLAACLEERLYPVTDFLLDLHGGDWNESLTPLVFHPVAVSEAVRQKAEAAAAALTVPLRVASRADNGLYSRAAHLGIPALLLERGCQGQWSESEVTAMVEDVLCLLDHLGVRSHSPSEHPFQAAIRQARYLEAPNDGFWYPAVSAGASVQQGQILGRLVDAGGRELAVYTADWDGIVLYHTVTLGVQQGDALVAYGRP